MKTGVHVISEWEIASFDNEAEVSDNAVWRSVSVPEDVHSFLIKNGEIGDPAYGTNDVRCLWVEKKIWIYRTLLHLDEAILQKKHIDLEFDGIDTFSSVYVNGDLVLETGDMFIKYVADIKEHVHSGENEIRVVFHSLSDLMKRRELPENFWINYSTERAYARKVGYSFGWDWTGRVVTAGIWKEVRLHAYDYLALDDVRISYNLTEDYSRCDVHVEAGLRNGFDINDCDISLEIHDGNGLVAKSDSFYLTLANPRLWYTHDQGESFLYDIRLRIAYGEESICYQHNIGFRKIELLEGNESKPSFLYKINGRKLFLRGANWVPLSHRPAAVDDRCYERILQMVKDAGMNFLVVWGGGVYERDIFYELCDKLGIFVWQYFMFACGEYPDFDDEFVKLVHEEVIQNAQRLSSYSCIGSFIGNVENTHISEKIGLDRDVHGDRLFFSLIPEWLKDEGIDVLYRPTSPYGGPFANSMEKGDRHNWDVWFKLLPYQDYGKDSTLFASEFGIHATPVYDQVLKFTGNDAVSLSDYSFRYLNKDQSPETMMFYIKQHIGVPRNVEEYTDMSLLVQAEALKYACVHYRCRFPECGGAAIWQLNDCCACQSWSMIDYEMVPKASYYYAKRFFKDVALLINETSSNEASVVLCNNSDRTIKRQVRIVLQDFFGNIAYDKSISVEASPNTNVVVENVRIGGRFFPNIIIWNRIRNFVLSASFEDGDTEDVHLFGDYKEIPFPSSFPEVKVRGNELILKSEIYHHFVQIGGDMPQFSPSDNFFFLMPDEEKTISIEKNQPSPIRIYIKDGIAGERRYYEI